MKIDYTSSIVVVEDAFGINDLNWNPTPRRRRARQNEAQRLAAQFTFIHLLLAPPRLPRVEPLSINHEDLLVEHQGIREPIKKRTLKTLVQAFKPHILLQEAKMQSPGVSDVWRFWGPGPLPFCFAPYQGASAGLLTIWDPLVLVRDVLSVSFLVLSFTFSKLGLRGCT
ncbi:hypothetical protein AMTRI_Chr12g238040 [Amborella trichopoda]